MDASTLIHKLDTVIEKITKSKKYASVRILEEVKHELITNGIPEGMPANAEAPVARSVAPAVSGQRSEDHNGAEPYVPQNGEVDALAYYISAGHNCLITGPAGCGKTHLVEHVCAMLGKTYETIQGEEGARKEDVLGYRDIEGGNTVYTYGILPRMMQTENGIVYWDEPNMTPEGIRSVCHRAMDHRHEILLPESKGGEVIKAKKGFVIIGSMNEGRAYRGTSRFSPALKTRFGATIDLGYLPEDRERKMLVQRTGIDPNIAAKLCSAARQLRASEARGDIQTPISTRSLIACCDGIQHGAPIKVAVTLSIVNQVEGTNPTERKAVADVMEIHFGKAAK